MEYIIDLSEKFKEYKICFEIHPDMESIALDMLRKKIIDFLEKNSETEEYLVYHDLLKFTKSNNVLYINRYNSHLVIWEADITSTIANTIGEANILEQLNLPNENFLNSQNISLSFECFQSNFLIFYRVKPNNFLHSGWIIYPIKDYDSKSNLLKTDKDKLFDSSIEEVLDKINPSLKQALALPFESQFLYKIGTKEIDYIGIDKNIKIPLVIY